LLEFTNKISNAIFYSDLMDGRGEPSDGE